MNKKNSIFFQINLFFILIFIFINTLIIIQFILDNNAYEMIQKKRYFSGTKFFMQAKENGMDEKAMNEQLESFGLEATQIEFIFLRENATQIIKDPDEPFEILYYNNQKYIHLKPPRMFPKDNKMFPPPPPHFEDLHGKERFFKPIIFIDTSSEHAFEYFWLLVLLCIDILLIWFFIFLNKKLTPLHILKSEIIKFSNGDLSISTKSNGKDEISQVANEFDEAIVQLRELKESRNLFLRNIMHELKTPITKGKIISDMLDQTQRKEILIRVFQRLEYLLSEFSRIEELTSGKIELVKNRYRVIDILEHAFDILLLDRKKVEVHNKDFILDVDFELFAIALKNLVDNAVKYNQNGKVIITIEKNLIKISNKGERLEKNIEEYLKPFNKEQKNTKEGLGLGLYITNSIIEIHYLKLDYVYENGSHNFVIQTTS